jgi:2-polyprenyl-6-methoxyphenol hydroxylase-like FAD-dependent oxidoreductase
MARVGVSAQVEGDPVPALIIGAGPAGLASAACLKQRGIEALVLEAAPALAEPLR